MFNLSKNIKRGVRLRQFCLVLIIFSNTFFLSKISKAEAERVLVTPMSVLGTVPDSEQQILFNRLREQLNQSFHIVSHKVLAIIKEKGIRSIDIEDCTSSKCVHKVLRMIKNLEQQFKTEKMFMFNLVRNKRDTQLSLKYVAMSVPEITRKLVTQICIDCGTEKLIQNLDILVQRMMQKLVSENIGFPEEGISQPAREIAQPAREIAQPAKEIAQPAKEIAQPAKEIAQPEGGTSKKKSTSPETAKTSELAENKISVQEELDPYILARDSYNQHIGKLLLDVTYALQIFRSGMVVMIEISLDSSGEVVDQKIIKTSGSRDFDETTMMTLEEIQFDPLPDELLKFGNYAVILQIQNFR